jgi:hypothetical protein
MSHETEFSYAVFNWQGIEMAVSTEFKVSEHRNDFLNRSHMCQSEQDPIFILTFRMAITNFVRTQCNSIARNMTEENWSEPSPKVRGFCFSGNEPSNFVTSGITSEDDAC